MKKKTKSVIDKYERACDDVANVFAEIYFEKPYMYWIGDTIGEVIGINDHFFSIDDMRIYLNNEATKEEMFGYYDYTLECNEKSTTKHVFEYWRTKK